MTTDSGCKTKPFVALVDTHHLREGSHKCTKKREYSIIQLSDPCNANVKRQYLSYLSSNDNISSYKDKDNNNTTNSNSSNKNNQTSIYEIHNIPHSKSEEYSSFFVGSRVISNPCLHLINRIDPLYLLLSYYETDVELNFKWQPWFQLCQSKNIHPSITRELFENKSQLKHFFEVNGSLSSTTEDKDANDGDDDSDNDDLLLFKFSTNKVLTWLQQKVKNVESILEKQLISRRCYEKKIQDENEQNTKQNGGAFSASFVLPENDKHTISRSQTSPVNKEVNDKQCPTYEIILSKEESEKILISSIQMICEYVSPSWQEKLIASMNLNMSDIIESSCKTTPTQNDISTEVSSSPENTKIHKKPATVTPTSPQSSTMSEADKLLHYTTGGRGATGKDSMDDPNDKKRKNQSAQSVGLKRLQKGNTKGMKSLSSFFGPAASKKKKLSVK